MLEEVLPVGVRSHSKNRHHGLLYVEKTGFAFEQSEALQAENCSEVER